MASQHFHGNKSGREVVQHEYWEALYPGEFSDLVPGSLEQPVEPKGWDKSLSLPIISLSHITHNKEASSIWYFDLDSFTFLARQKFGKSDTRDGSPMGTTFRKVNFDGYVEVPNTSSVFPGYLSWWGISCQECYRADPAGRKFRQAIDEMKLSVYPLYEAGYLKIPPRSKYGNRAFIFSLQDLIESYKQSRKDCKIKDAYLRKAGTLRYCREVCYVVMVVMLKDLNDSCIRAMPSMFDEPCFEHNGCINKDGKLLNYCTPHFKVKRPFTKFEEDFLSWETLAFAFYFERSDQKLQCSKQYGREEQVQHFSNNCISKQPPPFEEYSEWLCPNDLKP